METSIKVQLCHAVAVFDDRSSLAVMEMISAAGFVDLPEELCELVAAQIDFGDLCSLRLSAREIASKVSHGRFKSHFMGATLKLSYGSCQSFAAVTEHGGLSCMLENLTIVGLPDLPGQDIVSSEADGPGMTVCLTQALSNLRLHSRSGSLRSLVLSVQDAVTRDHHYHVAMYSKDQIRACAFSTERIVAQAVKASAIPIETVELYGSSFVLVVTSNEKLEDGGYHIDQSHNISALLTQLSQLERLDLRWCNARRTDLTGADLIDRLFFAGVAPLSFTSLNDLSLKGIYTTSTDLLTFLQRHVQLRNLCLERVKLLDGTFDPIFGHMSDIMELDSFYMCDLSHASEFARLQFIGVVGRNLYGHGGPPTRIRREGVHTRERLQYKIITERVRGDGRNQRYYRDVKDRFD